MPNTAYILVGIQELQLGPGSFPIDASLPAIAVELNDVFVAAAWINGIYAGTGWSWAGTLGPGPWLTMSPSAFPTVSGNETEFWNTVAGTQQASVIYSGFFQSASNNILRMQYPLPVAGPSDYDSVYLMIAVYRLGRTLTPNSPGQVCPSYDGHYSGDWSNLQDVCPAPPSFNCFGTGTDFTKPFLAVATFSPGSGTPAGFTARGALGLVADAPNLSTFTNAGFTGVMYLDTWNSAMPEASCPGVCGYPLVAGVPLSASPFFTPGDDFVGSSGGFPPYSYAISSGLLPPGLTLDTATGQLLGIPTTPGTYAAAFQITDSLGNVSPPSTGCPFQITGGGETIVLSCNNPPVGFLLNLYGHAFVASGGEPPYTWALLSGSLPPSLILDGLTGVVSGIPTDSGVFGFTLQVTDSDGETGTGSCSITVGGSLKNLEIILRGVKRAARGL